MHQLFQPFLQNTYCLKMLKVDSAVTVPLSVHQGEPVTNVHRNSIQSHHSGRGWQPKPGTIPMPSDRGTEKYHKQRCRHTMKRYNVQTMNHSYTQQATQTKFRNIILSGRKQVSECSDDRISFLIKVKTSHTK